MCIILLSPAPRGKWMKIFNACNQIRKESTRFRDPFSKRIIFNLLETIRNKHAAVTRASTLAERRGREGRTAVAAGQGAF